MTIGINVKKEKQELDGLLKQLEDIKNKNLKIDMTRGKPSKEQLDISKSILYNIDKEMDLICYDDNDNPIDIRNYGCLTGIKELKEIFKSILNVDTNRIIIGGNSSLNLMYDTISKAFIFGLKNSKKPWGQLDNVKFLCPVPGYDRHFSMCESFNIEMVNIEMDENGPDMKKVREYVENDESVKGMWCVPKYSNPSGIIYSDDVVRELATLKPKASDFTIFYDNAYFAHSLFSNEEELLDIFSLIDCTDNEDMVIGFTSTSKITSAGGGVSLIYSSKGNIDYIGNLMKYQIISYDKINQYRHFLFLKDKENLKEIMRKHSDIMSPKFKAVIDIMNEHKEKGLTVDFNVPKGGYFISVNVKNGCAKRVIEICKSVGVLLTSAGSTYPYKKDNLDTNIRIAPSFITLDEVKIATNVMMLATKIAETEKS